MIATILRDKGHDCVSAGRGETVEAAVRILSERGIGAIVVTEDDGTLAGIFSERDLVSVLAREGSAALGRRLDAVMTSPVVTCRPDDSVDHVLALMTERGIRHAPVLAEARLAGMISIRDLVRSRLGEKEIEAAVLLDISRRHG